MGSSTMIDIIASFIIAGFILLMIINLNQSVADSAYVTTNDLAVQTNMTTLVQIIESDFRKIGYCSNPTNFPDPTKAMREATAHSIKFLTDVDGNGNIDSIRYSIGDTSSCRSTANPRDVMLYRQINQQTPQKLALGVVRFDFLYYNTLMDSLTFPIATVSQVSSIRLSILLESPYAYDTTYSYSYWRQLRLAARNLRNR
jgi:type II secretory pathway component PulJ